MRLKIRGKHWQLRFADIEDYGECDPPTKKGKTITLREGMSEKDELDTLIHEIIHACNWDLSEDAVYETANSITSALWRQGWRKKQTV